MTLFCAQLQEEYLLHTCFAAVGHDSLNSSRPISSPAENPTQIKQMFDTVSYDKVCNWWCQFITRLSSYTCDYEAFDLYIDIVTENLTFFLIYD